MLEEFRLYRSTHLGRQSTKHPRHFAIPGRDKASANPQGLSALWSNLTPEASQPLVSYGWLYHAVQVSFGGEAVRRSPIRQTYGFVSMMSSFEISPRSSFKNFDSPPLPGTNLLVVNSSSLNVMPFR